MTQGEGVTGGRYRLLREIGRGGMGTVWLAQDTELDRQVAIKQLASPHGLPADERARQIERVRREARLAARLDHPGIVRVYDVVEWDGRPAIVMEYVEGGSLAARLRASGPLTEAETARLGTALLDALRHAHAAGVVHRDLKPDNVLISGERVVITDFGIARPLDEATLLTLAGTVIGTPAYMSPEQLEGKEASPASDLWSLGVTLYSAVEGTLPFEGDLIAQLIAAVLTRPMRPPRKAGALTPLLQALLTKDPAQRISAEAAAKSLARPGAGTGRISALGRRVRRPRVYVPAIAVACLAIVAAFVLPDAHGTSGSPPAATRTPAPGATLFANGRLAATFTLPGDRHGNSVAFAPHGTSVATGSDDAATFLWNTTTGQNTSFADADARNAVQQGAATVAFSPDGRLMATSDDSASADDVYLWDTATGKPAGTLPGADSDCAAGVDALAFAPRGGMLAVGAEYGNGTVCLWNTATKKLARTLTDPDGGGASALAFSPDGTSLVTGDSGGQGFGSVYLWDVASGKITATLKTPDNYEWGAVSVTFSADGKTFATADGPFNDSLYVWNADTGALVSTLRAPKGQGVNAVAFAPRGTTLAAADDDGDTYLWDTATKQITGSFTDTQSLGVKAVAFAPDGATLASMDYNGLLYLWRFAS